MPSYFFPLILLAILLTLFGCHYLLYRAVISLFTITGSSQKTILALIITGLSVSFIAASFLMRWNDNLLTRGFYVFSGFWIGLLINLLLASALTILWRSCILFMAFGTPFIRD
jgi:hypothetical protein